MYWKHKVEMMVVRIFFRTNFSTTEFISKQEEDLKMNIFKIQYKKSIYSFKNTWMLIITSHQRHAN